MLRRGVAEDSTALPLPNLGRQTWNNHVRGQDLPVEACQERVARDECPLLDKCLGVVSKAPSVRKVVSARPNHREVAIPECLQRKDDMVRF